MTKNNFGEIQDEVMNSEAYKIYRRLERLHINFEIFRRNYEEFKSLLVKLEDTEKFLQLWQPRNRKQLEIVLIEITRHLFNVVASAKSFVDYTRNIISGNYSGTEFYQMYKKEVSKRFINNSMIHFVEDLRNYSIHYSFPLASARVNARSDFKNKGVLIHHNIILDKNDLLKWSNWQKGKTFLKTASEQIIVDDLMGNYFKAISNFFIWTMEQLKSLHSEELVWLEVTTKPFGDFWKTIQDDLDTEQS